MTLTLWILAAIVLGAALALGGYVLAVRTVVRSFLTWLLGK